MRACVCWCLSNWQIADDGCIVSDKVLAEEALLSSFKMSARISSDILTIYIYIYHEIGGQNKASAVPLSLSSDPGLMATYVIPSTWPLGSAGGARCRTGLPSSNQLQQEDVERVCTAPLGC